MTSCQDVNLETIHARCGGAWPRVTTPITHLFLLNLQAAAGFLPAQSTPDCLAWRADTRGSAARPGVAPEPLPDGFHFLSSPVHTGESSDLGPAEGPGQ